MAERQAAWRSLSTSAGRSWRPRSSTRPGAWCTSTGWSRPSAARTRRSSGARSPRCSRPSSRPRRRRRRSRPVRRRGRVRRADALAGGRGLAAEHPVLARLPAPRAARRPGRRRGRPDPQRRDLHRRRRALARGRTRRGRPARHGRLDRGRRRARPRRPRGRRRLRQRRAHRPRGRRPRRPAVPVRGTRLPRGDRERAQHRAPGPRPRAGARPPAPTRRPSTRDAARGHPIARAALARAGSALGVAIASAVHLCDVEVVAIGGGLSQAGPLLFDPLQEAFARHAQFPFTRNVRIVPAALGQHAGPDRRRRAAARRPGLLVGRLRDCAARSPGRAGRRRARLRLVRQSVLPWVPRRRPGPVRLPRARAGAGRQRVLRQEQGRRERQRPRSAGRSRRSAWVPAVNASTKASWAAGGRAATVSGSRLSWSRSTRPASSAPSRPARTDASTVPKTAVPTVRAEAAEERRRGGRDADVGPVDGDLHRQHDDLGDQPDAEAQHGQDERPSDAVDVSGPSRVRPSVASVTRNVPRTG